MILMAVLLRMSPAIPSSIPAWLGAREVAGILPGITLTGQKVETSMNVHQMLKSGAWCQQFSGYQALSTVRGE